MGVDQDGNLIIAELKRGVVGEGAISQALAYAAEYAEKSVDALAIMFASHSEKQGRTGLVRRAQSPEDARLKLAKHVGADIEVNESQILVLVGEEFDAKTLAICDYLNGASGEATFSIECWRYGLYQDSAARSYFVLEQILPPPSVRRAIEEKREAARQSKYARDPVRVQFMRELIGHFGNAAPVTAWRSPGQSYECRLKHEDWTVDHDLWFSVKDLRPKIVLPSDLRFAGNAPDQGLSHVKAWDDQDAYEFADLDSSKLAFNADFARRLVKIVGQLEPIASSGPTGLPVEQEALTGTSMA
jgi:hypothetical protein